MSTEEAVTVRVALCSPATSVQKVALRLYIYDNRLADAPAALSASAECNIPSGESSSIVTMHPDMTVSQVEKTWEAMVEPSMYVSLNISDGTVTYVSGPAFGVQPGATVELKVKPKE